MKTVDLTRMNKQELVKLCRDNNIKNYSNKNKIDLIQYIVNTMNLENNNDAINKDDSYIDNINNIEKGGNLNENEVNEKLYIIYRYELSILILHYKNKFNIEQYHIVNKFCYLILDSYFNKVEKSLLIQTLEAPGGAGKSYVIAYIMLILKKLSKVIKNNYSMHPLHKKKIRNISFNLCATTNSACRTLEKSLMKYNVFEPKISIVNIHKTFKIILNYIEDKKKNKKETDEYHEDKINKVLFWKNLDKICKEINTLHNVTKEYLDTIKNINKYYEERKLLIINNNNGIDNSIEILSKNQNYDRSIYNYDEIDKILNVLYIINNDKYTTEEIDSDINKNNVEKILDTKKDELIKNIERDFYVQIIDKIKKINISQYYIENSLTSYLMIIHTVISLTVENKKIETLDQLLSFRKDDLTDKFNCIHTVIEKNKQGVYKCTPKFTSIQSEMNARNEFTERDYYSHEYKYLHMPMIIDESSMIDEDKYEFIKYLSEVLLIPVIFVGDSCQLPPVNKNNPHYCVFDNIINDNRNYLTIIERANNHEIKNINRIVRDLTLIKDDSIYIQEKNKIMDELINDKHEHIFTLLECDVKNLINNLCNEEKDFLCVAFHNKIVNNYNNIIRNNVYTFRNNYNYLLSDYIIGEEITCNKYTTFYKINIKKYAELEKIYELKNERKMQEFFTKLLFNNKTETYNSFIKEETHVLTSNDKFIIINIFYCFFIFENIKIDINIIICKDYNNTYFIYFDVINNKELLDYIFDERLTRIQNIRNTIVYQSCDDDCEYHNICLNYCNYINQHIEYHHKNKISHCYTCAKCNTIKIHKNNSIERYDICQCNNNCKIIHCNICTCKLYCKFCKKCNDKCKYCAERHIEDYLSTEVKYFKFLFEIFNITIVNLDNDLNSIDNDPNKDKCNLTYSYSCTIHKSQGKTVENVIIDIKDVNSASDYKMQRKLLYTSISRASNNIYLII